MVKMNIRDWSCAELIHSYIDLHFNNFCMANTEKDTSELEYAINNRYDFRDWAEAMGYKIEF